MPALKIMGFDGIVPRASATMLSDNQAQQADNVKLYSRELRYWRGPTLSFTPAISNIQTIYRHYGASVSYWLTWQNDVNVVQSPTTDSTDYRLYYTGDGVPKKTNETLISTGTGAYPRGWLNMGVPAPTGAPTVTPNTGIGTTEARAYVYTYVSTFGSLKEESAPSPATLVSTVYSSGAVISGFSAAPTTNYNITAIRIYRSISGATTDNYVFVAEIPIATSSYNDTLTSAQLGAAITTIGWTPPPSNLAGLVALPSGALAGFAGNTVYFSEPYYPHAWPTKYAVNVPFKVVGLGVFGSSVVVMTDRYPHIINGGIPGAMSVERVPILEPCVAKKSIISGVDGVLYASPNGLVSIGYNSRNIITNNLFRRDEWQAYNPTFIQATSYDNKYIAAYSSAISGINSFVLSPDDIPALSKISLTATAVHVDNVTGQLFYCASDDGKIYQADADDLNPLTYQWKSKRFSLPVPTSFSALRLDAEYSQASTAAAYNAQVAAIKARNATLFSSNLLGALNTCPLNHSYNDSFYTAFPYRGVTVNGSILTDIPPDASARSVQVLIYGDGQLQTTLNLTSFDSIRIPPFKSRDVELVIRGTVNVRSVTLATTVQEVHQ
jgi:hypothetical protein